MANTRDQASTGNILPIKSIRRQSRQFQKRATWIKERLNTSAGEQFTTAFMALSGFL
jgi:hypothetical protein